MLLFFAQQNKRKLMKELIKSAVRELLILLSLDLTKNLKYDRLTRKIIQQNFKSNFNCIDIGCHKGEILDLVLKYAPKGKHYAFEPIPYLYQDLIHQYSNKATVFPYALSDKSGKTTFQLVKNALAYSGIKKRRYDIKNPEIEEIEVELKTLDELIPTDHPVHFMKIDVEGAEFGVLKGSKQLLKNHKPIILFEFGKGASDFYGTTPSDLYHFISQEIGMQIFTLSSFVSSKQVLNKTDFTNHFNSGEEYYFVAASS